MKLYEMNAALKTIPKLLK